ncbi:MAG: hypothetical protein CMD81_12095 [Gammaproteobacteria bacterium]|nr:hypothetical protein [Gammaproteobacteria bacterium]|tara:strand:- start:70552 stop:72987 length:2436 start_codon:yes stop_codon:yes gene_type:complete
MKATTTGSIQLPLIQTDSGKSISTAKKNILGTFFVAALAVTSGAIGYRVGKGPSNEVPAGASALSDYAQAWLDNGLQHNGDIRSVGYFQDFPLLNVLSQNLSHICKDVNKTNEFLQFTQAFSFATHIQTLHSDFNTTKIMDELEHNTNAFKKQESTSAVLDTAHEVLSNLVSVNNETSSMFFDHEFIAKQLPLIASQPPLEQLLNQALKSADVASNTELEQELQQALSHLKLAALSVPNWPADVPLKDLHKQLLDVLAPLQLDKPASSEALKTVKLLRSITLSLEAIRQHIQDPSLFLNKPLAIDVPDYMTTTPWSQAQQHPCVLQDDQDWVNRGMTTDKSKTLPALPDYVIARGHAFASTGLLELGLHMVEEGLKPELPKINSEQNLKSALSRLTEPKGILNQIWLDSNQSLPLESWVHHQQNQNQNRPLQYIAPLKATQLIVKELSTTFKISTDKVFAQLPQSLQNPIKKALISTQNHYLNLGQTPRLNWINSIQQMLGLKSATNAPETLILNETKDQFTPGLPLTQRLTLRTKEQVVIQGSNSSAINNVSELFKKLYSSSPTLRQDLYESRTYINHKAGEPSTFKIQLADLDEGVAGYVSGGDEVTELTLDEPYYGSNATSKDELMRVLVHEIAHNLQPGLAHFGVDTILQPSLGKFIKPHDRQQMLWMDRILNEVGIKREFETPDYNNDAVSLSFLKNQLNTIKQVLLALNKGDAQQAIHILEGIDQKALVNLMDYNPQKGTGNYYNNFMSMKEAVLQHAVIIAHNAVLNEKAPKSVLGTIKELTKGTTDEITKKAIDNSHQTTGQS